MAAAIGAALLSGNLPRQLGLPGIAATGLLLFSMILLGLFALWFGRSLARGEIPVLLRGIPGEQSAIQNQAMAIWAFACLMIVLPVGILVSRLWLP
jgi:hypothetical protein